MVGEELALLRAGLSTPRASRIDSSVEEDAAAAVAALRVGAEAPIAGKALVEAAFKEIFPASFQTVLPVRNHKARGAALRAPPIHPLRLVSSLVRPRTTPQRGSRLQAGLGETRRVPRDHSGSPQGRAATGASVRLQPADLGG